MSDIRKHAVEQTGTLHLRDAADELMYADDADGKPDKSKPCEVVLYSPGSKIHAKAAAAQNNRLLDKFKAKGKTKQSAEEAIEEKSIFLADVTASFNNIAYGELADKDLFKAVYADREIGFIADQVQAFLGDWANFTKRSPTA